MHIFSTIGDDGSRQDWSDAAILAAVVWNSLPKTVCVENCSHKSSMNSLQYIFHCFFENSSEICIQYIFHVIKNLHKENAHLFFHYWRRREPPVPLRGGEFRSSFWKLDVVFVSCEFFLSIFIMLFSFDTLLRRKYFDTLLRRNYFYTNLHKEITCFLPLLATTGAARCPQMRSFSFGFYH